MGDGINGGPSVGDGVEGGSRLVDISWKGDSVTCDNLSKEGKLSNTSMLDLNVTESVETLLVGIVKKSERIEESKRWLNSKLSLEGVEGSGSLGNLCRCESGGRGSKGGGND